MDGAGLDAGPAAAAGPAGRRRAWCGRRPASGPGGPRSRAATRPCRRAARRRRGGPWSPPATPPVATAIGDRVGQVRPGQPVDAAVQRGGEQQPLAAGLGHVEDPGDVGQEAEVGHVVGLVDRGDLDLGERALALPDQVEQPAGGGDEQVDAAAQRGDLAAHRTRRRRRRAPARRAGWPSGASASCTWPASSRVGTSTSPPGAPAGRRPAPAVSRASIGSPKASVLPEPVSAAAEHVPAGERVRQGAGLDRERRA